MRELLSLLLIISALFSLIIASGGVLVWLASVAGEALTPAQESLLNTADWMIKSCVGAIVGLAGGMRLARGRANGAQSG